MIVLVDSNVVLDLLSGEGEWADWSRAAVKSIRRDNALVINDIVWTEASIRYEDATTLNDDLARIGFRNEALSEDVLFEAGKAFLRYRRSGGSRTSVLPDFFIGAQARMRGWPLLTRDASRYQTYFPTVRLIAP